MWPPALFLGIVALLAVTVGLMIAGMVIFAIPIFIVGVVALGVIDFQRRRRHAGEIKDFRDQAKADKVEFTERDQQTLAS